MRAALAGWIQQQQRNVVDYLQEESRALMEQLGPVKDFLPGRDIGRTAILLAAPTRNDKEASAN